MKIRSQVLIKICSRCAMSIAVFLLAGFIPASAQQTGVITGRVVTEDGAGVPNVQVGISQVSTGQTTVATGMRPITTDEEGNFRFTDLAPRLYSVNVFQTKGYAVQPVPASERRERRLYRVGDNVTITLIKGGVITGRVTTAEGDPVVGVQVSAMMVRDAEGFKVRQVSGVRLRITDDRGIYRLYGLVPGTYVVFTGGAGFYYQSPHEGNIPTYHPSSTRDTASEVSVTNGGEATGVDIRYRAERGHVISGTVTGGGEPSMPYVVASVTLASVATGAYFGMSSARSGEGNNAFAIIGVTDGEYEIIARRGWNEESLSSMPRRLTVKGADVTGIELKLAPLASIAGRAVLENSQNACEEKGKNAIEETMLSMRRDEKTQGGAATSIYYNPDTAISEKGEFTIRNLMAGHYRIEHLLPSENWYVKSMSVPSAAPARRTTGAARPANESDVARAGITVKAADKLTGLTVTVSEGAAGLNGKVIAEAEGSQLPSRLRIHLVPGEPAADDDVLRYAETLLRNDRTFTFKNIAPGKYWLLARIVPDDEMTDRMTSPVAWDSAERAKLRKEAEAKKIEIELKPCQRVTDYALKY